MVTRVGGLASGMDIDSIVEKLMTAEKAPLNKLYQQQQKYEWQRDAYREVNTSLSTFDSYLFDNFRLSSNFYKKTVSSSNSSLVTATATSSATGSLSIDGVSQLASSARGVGNTINATGSTKLSNLGITDSSVKLNAIQANGKMLDNAVEITIGTDETVDSFIKKINSSSVGVTALFENGKLSITAKNMGNNANGGEVTVESGASTFTQLGFTSAGTTGVLAEGGSNAIFSINGIATERSSNTFSINGYTVTLGSTFNSQSTLAENTKSLANNAFIASSQFTDALNTLNTATNNVTDKSKALSDHIATSSSNSATTFNTALGNVTNNDKLNSFLMNLGANSAEKLKQLANLDFTDANTLTTSIESLYDVNASQNLFTQDEENAIKKLFVNEVDNSITSEGLIFSNFSQEISTVNSGLTDANDQQLTFDKIADYFNANLELANANNNVLNTNDNYKTALNAYKDALKTNYNIDMLFGYTGTGLVDSSSIQFSQGGVAKSSTDIDNLLKSEISSAVTTAPVTLTSSTDTDNMVTKIKEFVNTYNGLISNINSKLKESYNRSYQPLTEDQKKDMKEDEITKWETKAKTGLLRNDSILTNGLYDLRRTFSNNVAGLGDSTIDSLAEIGITTSSVTSDRGKLVINEDKLRAAIEKNPDQVASIFTNTGEVTTKTVNGKKVTEDSRGIAQRLRDELKDFTTNIEKKAGKTTSTNQTFTIGKRLVEIEGKISSWKDKLDNAESRYWKQFTAMETAINKANSQSSLFASA